MDSGGGSWGDCCCLSAVHVQGHWQAMIEYQLVWNDDQSIQLTCDECGHVNHWKSPIELDEVMANAQDHTEESHSES